MKINTILQLVSISLLPFVSGCKKDKKDKDTSTNSDYAGTWNVNETCTSSWSYQMTITASGSTGVTIANFHKGTSQSGFTVNGTVSDKTLTIPSQQASSSHQGGPYTFSGSGTFTPPSTLKITYTMKDASGTPLNCTANCTK